MPQTIDPTELGARVREKRLAHGQSVRQAAQEAGVSPATLSRVERGDHLPDRENLLLLAQWIGVSLDQLTLAIGGTRATDDADGADEEVAALHQARNAIVHSPGETTPESIALHLRADRDLTPEDVELLMEVFRAAYERLRKRNEG